MRKGSLSSLPKWAQEEISHLDVQVARLKQELAVKDLGTENLHVWDPRSAHCEYMPTRYSSGRFMFDANKVRDYVDFYKTTTPEGPCVYVHSLGRLYVEPRASNSLYLRTIL